MWKPGIIGKQSNRCENYIAVGIFKIKIHKFCSYPNVKNIDLNVLVNEWFGIKITRENRSIVKIVKINESSGKKICLWFLVNVVNDLFT